MPKERNKADSYRDDRHWSPQRWAQGAEVDSQGNLSGIPARHRLL